MATFQTDGRIPSDALAPLPISLIARSFLGQPFDDSSSLEQRVALLPVEFGDGLRKPHLLRLAILVAQLNALLCQRDQHLTTVGSVRRALDDAHFIKRGDGGPHPLRSE